MFTPDPVVRVDVSVNGSTSSLEVLEESEAVFDLPLTADEAFLLYHLLMNEKKSATGRWLSMNDARNRNQPPTSHFQDTANEIVSCRLLLDRVEGLLSSPAS